MLIDRLRGTRAPAMVRIVTGAVLVFASNGKFLDYANVVDAFRDFEVPWPEVVVPVVGAVELIGGVLLVLGVLTRTAAIANAAVMIGAVATAGRVDGGPVHLVIAPLLLLCLLFVIWTARPTPGCPP